MACPRPLSMYLLTVLWFRGPVRPPPRGTRESLRGDRPSCLRVPPTTAHMAGESSDDEGPEEVSLQSGRDAATQQRSQEKEVTQKSRCVPPSCLAQVACTFTRLALLTAGRAETRRGLRRSSARSSALRSSRSASPRSCCRSSLLRAGERRLIRSPQMRTMPRMRMRSVRGSGAGSDNPRPGPGCPRCSGGVITWRWLWHRGASVSPMELSCRPSCTSNCTGRG
jgi:hypothetical protein